MWDIIRALWKGGVEIEMWGLWAGGHRNSCFHWFPVIWMMACVREGDGYERRVNCRGGRLRAMQ